VAVVSVLVKEEVTLFVEVAVLMVLVAVAVAVVALLHTLHTIHSITLHT